MENQTTQNPIQDTTTRPVLTPTLPTNRNLLIALCSVVVFLFLSSAAYLYYQNQQLKGVPLQKIDTSYKNVIVALKAALPLKTDEIKNSTFEWVITFKKLIPMTGQSFSSKGATDKDGIKMIESTINPFFTSLGFTKNDINTANTLDSESSLARLSYGFSRDDVNCLIVMTQGFPSDWYFACGKVDDPKEKLRKEFTAIFDAKDAKDSKGAVVLGPDDTRVITVEKVLGNYATGRDDGYSKGVYLPSGAFWIAVKTNEQWQIIGNGQDYFPCSTIDLYKVPIEIYKNCYSGLDSTLRF